MNDLEIANRWLEGTDWRALLAAIDTISSERKLRLFAVACCRSIWRMLPDKRSRDAALVAERFADGLVDQNVLTPAFHAVHTSMGRNDPPRLWAKGCAQRAARAAAHVSAHEAAATAAQEAAGAMGWSAWAQAQIAGEKDDAFYHVRHAALLEQIGVETALWEEICPPPPAAQSKGWRTPAIVQMAQGIYDERSYVLLPILADALEEAGCADAGLVTHCRRPGGHARGCWALDSILDKT